MESAHLTLDVDSLSAEQLSLPALLQELDLQQRPAWPLRQLMAVLEYRRRKDGLGWNRPWNIDGLDVFRTHVQDPREDGEYFAPLYPVFAELLPQAPAPYRKFAEALLRDPALATFTFYHNHADETGRQHEGLTLSLGCPVASDQARFDRLDLVLEDRRIAGRVDGRLDRLRLYLSPWTHQRHDLTCYHSEQTGPALAYLTPAQELYEHCVRHYHRWKGEAPRQWHHRSVRGEVFAPRSFIPIGTSFF